MTTTAAAKTTAAKTATKAAGRSKPVTPWGAATILEEVSVPQQAGGKRFSLVVQLLEPDGGELLVRVAYSTDGVARRGPVTFRARDLERLRKAVARRPGLASTFGVQGEVEA
jgi:hypothetical protein